MDQIRVYNIHCCMSTKTAKTGSFGLNMGKKLKLFYKLNRNLEKHLTLLL